MPQQNQITSDQLHSMVSSLSAKYGLDHFQNTLQSYSVAVGRMNTINQELLEANPTTNPDEYAKLVEDALAATRGYYSIVGELPEDYRQFFAQLTEQLDDGTNTDQIGEMIGTDFLFDTTPLLKLQSIRPSKFIMQVDAITNQLTSLGEKNKLKVGGRGNQPIKTSVTLDMPAHMKIEGGGMLSTYDKSIINGITSLIESGNTVFSLPMLYHAMTGKQNPTVDESLAEELGGKLEKMRRMILSIDLTEESRARYITDDGEPLSIEDLTIEGYLLPLNKMSGVINGKRTEVYQVIQNPPLYSYSKMKRQLASVPITLLSAPINNNSTTIPLKTYLLQRIELMKNKRNNMIANNILYDTIYSELGASDANKTKKMRIRTYTSTILQYFVDQGYITSFTEYKTGRNVAGIRIAM